MTEKELKARWAEISAQCDLSEPKVIYDEKIDNSDFTPGEVIITTRRSKKYLDLSPEDFGWSNIKFIEDLNDPAMFNPTIGQTYIIHLKKEGKDEVIAAVRHLEKLDFIRSAFPNRYAELD